MTRPARIALVAAGVLVVLAVAALVAGLTVAGETLLSLAGVLGAAVGFYLVGLSEDRDRQRHPRG